MPDRAGSRRKTHVSTPLNPSSFHPDQVVGIREAVAFLGISEERVRSLIAEGRLSAIQYTARGRFQFVWKDLIDYRARNRTGRAS